MKHLFAETLKAAIIPLISKGIDNLAEQLTNVGQNTKNGTVRTVETGPVNQTAAHTGSRRKISKVKQRKIKEGVNSGWTAKEIAKYAGVSLSTVNRYAPKYRA